MPKKTNWFKRTVDFLINDGPTTFMDVEMEFFEYVNFRVECRFLVDSNQEAVRFAAKSYSYSVVVY